MPHRIFSTDFQKNSFKVLLILILCKVQILKILLKTVDYINHLINELFSKVLVNIALLNNTEMSKTLQLLIWKSVFVVDNEIRKNS